MFRGKKRLKTPWRLLHLKLFETGAQLVDICPALLFEACQSAQHESCLCLTWFSLVVCSQVYERRGTFTWELTSMVWKSTDHFTSVFIHSP